MGTTMYLRTVIQNRILQLGLDVNDFVHETLEKELDLREKEGLKHGKKEDRTI